MTVNEVSEQYLIYLKVSGRSDRTIRGRTYDLRRFIRFLTSIYVFQVDDITGKVMSEYQEELAFSFTSKGRPLALRSQAQLLGVAKGFTCYLKENDYLLHDPSEKLSLPKKPKSLPKVILKHDEIQKIMKSPDLKTATGYRDRVILELFYDTAIRRAELKNMLISDMDLEAGYIRINGKGNKDRVVPVNDHVCKLVINYTSAIRPVFLGKNKDTGYLILNRWGNQMSGKGIWEIVKRHCRKAGIMKNVSPHTFRHTCATHMLKNGAPIRQLQELLGHESLESTQIYTHVTIAELKAVHVKYHPGEILNPDETT